MDPDLFQVVSDPQMFVELTHEQEQIMSIIKHQMNLQDQFTQLTKHCEILYTRLAEIEKLVHARVLS
jgi:hypothetical protein